MLRTSVAESVRTGRWSTGLFQTLVIGNIGQFGAPGRKGGASAAAAGEARTSVSANATNNTARGRYTVIPPILDPHGTGLQSAWRTRAGVRFAVARRERTERGTAVTRQEGVE